jgi:hypothetical protein
MRASTSHNPVDLHGLLQEQPYIFFYCHLPVNHYGFNGRYAERTNRGTLRSALVKLRAILVTDRKNLYSFEMLSISHCLDNRLTVNCEILATCSSTYSPVRTS